MIPRIIHQTWKNNDLLPHMKDSQKSFIDKNPNWMYVLWTDEMNRKLIQEHFPWFLEYYDNYEYNIQRADVIRYFILWLYGGVYADTDLLCNCSLDSLIDDMETEEESLAIVMSSHVNYYSNWFMISSAENPFWPQVWEMLIKVFDYKECPQCVTRHLKIMETTGPIFIHKCIRDYKPKLRRLDIGFNNCDVCDPKPCICEDCYVINLNAGAWNSWDSKILNLFLCNWHYMVLLLIIVFIVLILLKPCAKYMCIGGVCKK